MSFTQEEWALLNPSQKNLYKDVMMQTCRNLIAIGYKWNSQNIEEHCQSSGKHERDIICHSGNKPFVHKDYGKMQFTSLSPTTVRGYMNRLHEYDMNLQALGVPTTVGMNQQTYNGEKSYEYQG